MHYDQFTFKASSLNGRSKLMQARKLRLHQYLYNILYLKKKDLIKMRCWKIVILKSFHPLMISVHSMLILKLYL